MSETGKQDQPGGAKTPAGEAAQKAAERHKHLDERLDEALDETFPASDPIAVHEPRKDPSSP